MAVSRAGRLTRQEREEIVGLGRAIAEAIMAHATPEELEALAELARLARQGLPGRRRGSRGRGGARE